MAEQPFDATTYARAYRYGISAGIGHSEAVRHATVAARDADDDDAAYLCALASGCTEQDALLAVYAHRRAP